jgi:hypothetical protein
MRLVQHQSSLDASIISLVEVNFKLAGRPRAAGRQQYIADILLRDASAARELPSKLRQEVLLFRQTDETVITELQFINLPTSRRWIYLLGNYPYVCDDASQMCVL